MANNEIYTNQGCDDFDTNELKDHYIRVRTFDGHTLFVIKEPFDESNKSMRVLSKRLHKDKAIELALDILKYYKSTGYTLYKDEK